MRTPGFPIRYTQPMIQVGPLSAPRAALERYLRDSSPGCPERPHGVRTGDGENRIVIGDAVAVLPTLPSDRVDLVHTSPPYNIDKPYASSASDRGSMDDYRTFLRRAITELKRVVRPGGSIFWQTGYTQGGGESREIVPIDLLSYQLFREEPDPFLLWDRIIWRYWGGHAFTRKFTNKHETIMWYVKPGSEPTFSADAVRERAKEYDKRNNFWGRNPGNVWEVDRVAFGATEQTSHVAVFPEEIAERIVRACSEPGDLVLDPFAGSGTVPKVAHGLGRRWLGIELSPVYAGEAAVRVGFQQPSEADSLASELIKHVCFDGREGVLGIGETAGRLTAWIDRPSLGGARAAFEDDVASVFADGSGRNPVKREIWSKYDALLAAATGPQTPVGFADRLLRTCYKLRRHFNGVSRYRSALSALEEVADHLSRAVPADYVRRIAAQEPSSFRLMGERLALCSAQRTVSLRDEAPTSSDETPEAGGTSHSGSQTRMPL